MSDAIEVREDGKECAFFVKKPAWHGLGTVLENPPSIAEAIKIAGLDWEVKTQSITYEKELPTEQVLEGAPHAVPTVIEDYKAVVRQSDKKCLGVVGKKFVPLQNADAFDWFEPFIANKTATLEAAGSLQEGRRIWVLAKLAENQGGVEEIVPGDTVEQYLLLAHAHDGTLAIRVGFTTVRVVCQNTLTAAIKANEATSKLLKVRHTAKAPIALDLIRQIVDVSRKEFVANATVFRLLAATGCDEDTLKRYVREVYEPGTGNNEEAHPRLVEEVVTLFRGGVGVEFGKDTWWNAFNAVTEYITHNQGRSADGRLDSQWFGKGAMLTKRALDLAKAVATRSIVLSK